MVFKIDFIGGKAIAWSKKKDRVEAESYPDYNPRFYINGDDSLLFKSRPWISGRDNVVATKYERWKPTLSKDETKVLRIDVSSEEKLMEVVKDLKKNFSRDSFRFYNVGFSPQFRFCLQKDINPRPENSLRKIELELPRRHLANDRVSELRIDDEKVEGSEREALESLKRKMEQKDPDMIVVNRGQLLELLSRKIESSELNFSLGRSGGLDRLAGGNTVSCYGKTVHKNARYNIPGRAIIDRSNSFLLDDTNIQGLWGLVERSYRPIQELAWGSIGRLLTSIEVKKAYLEEKTLTPWKNWEGEEPKKASVMHKADRGGFIFNPEPEIHENVYEADFASLFPNIMVKKNISPETVRCECCENKAVPELDYSICEKQRGFISEVIKPLVEDRQEMKERIEEIDDGEERKQVQGSIDAIKWLLVSCFGYMGHAHASYGAIKCHQAIQAFDREIMVEAKEIFEENGYRIVHGIIDSIWVKPRDNAAPIEEVCREITEGIGIKMEFEHHFDWVAFVPRASSEAKIGTLNRYFGKKKEGGFKTAGIETEQSSSCEYVKKSQEEMIEVYDGGRSVEKVLEVLKQRIQKLEDSDVEPDRLVIRKKVSNSLEGYQVKNRSYAALKRAKKNNLDVKPGQEVRYVVRDDEAPAEGRVRLGFEDIDRFDSGFYTTQLVRAAESVLSPMGLDRDDISKRLNGRDMAISEALRH